VPARYQQNQQKKDWYAHRIKRLYQQLSHLIHLLVPLRYSLKGERLIDCTVIVSIRSRILITVLVDHHAYRPASTLIATSATSSRPPTLLPAEPPVSDSPSTSAVLTSLIPGSPSSPCPGLPTLPPNSPITLPGGQYSQIRSQPSLPQSLAPQPTDVVFFQTSWVKWPTSFENLRFS
jgi:hypothetical protein